MSIRKKHIIRHYTLIEVMVAMGIFLIMMTIMMQFFTSAQQMWNISSKRNSTYADARVAMNLMTREIQCMLYRNDETDGSGIYPFWYQWTDINVDGNSRVSEIKSYFLDNNDLLVQNGGSNSGNPYLTALNFIANTDLKSVDNDSDICEIRYEFIPVYFKNTTYSISMVRGGVLQRRCTEESNSGYNFAATAYKSPTAPANRIITIWRDSSSDTAQTVISGVYSLRFTCYEWDSSTGLNALKPMSNSERDPDDNLTGITYGYNLVTGTPAPVAVRIDMKLLAPEDLKKLAFAIYKSDTKQIRTLKQKMRTFSKVIYLGKREE